MAAGVRNPGRPLALDYAKDRLSLPLGPGPGGTQILSRPKPSYFTTK